MAESRSGGWLGRQIDFLGSGRLAVALLIASCCVLGLYLLVPQQGVDEAELLEWVARKGIPGRWCQALGFTDLLHSGWFWSIYGLLLVNLSVCMTRRLPIVLRLCRVPDRPVRPAAGWSRAEIGNPGLEPEQVARVLGRKGYRTVVADGTVYGLRGRLASAGHWVFHAGLLAVLVAGIFIARERDPFRGLVGVGEGEPFDLASARVVAGNRPVDPELPPLRFRLDRIDLRMADGAVERFGAVVSTDPGGEARLAINRPYRRSPYQVLMHGFGYMPGWVIVNPRGRVLNSAWVKLLPYPYQDQDWFSLGTEDSTVYVRFYPDHRRDGEEDRTLSQEIRNPRFDARVVWRGTEVFEGLLEPGQRIELEGGKDFFFLPDIRRYALLDVIEERAHLSVFSCLGMMILGLALRYVRTRKEIVAEVGERWIQLRGRGEILENLFAEELDRLAAELAAPGRSPDGGNSA